MGSYLRVTPRNALRAELRHRTALDRLPAKQRPEQRGIVTALREPTWNPTYVLWDAVFDGRLPFVKLEVLRDDPYEIGKEKALARLEEAYPEQLAGVREYLDRTREEFRLLRGLEPVDPVRGIQAPVRASAVQARAAADDDGHDDGPDDGTPGEGPDAADDGRLVDGGENVADQLAVSR
jgi:hypothetical protein